MFLVRHNDVLGPSKGGIRMTATVSLNEITGLAMEMTWKTSLVGVPVRRRQGGHPLRPRPVDATDKEILIRAFTRSARRHIGPEIYVPAPDMGTNERDMGHIRDCISYSGGTSITAGCFVTGKPVVLGGIVGRREATGNGVVATIAAACERMNLRLARPARGRAGLRQRRLRPGPGHRRARGHRRRRLRRDRRHAPQDGLDMRGWPNTSSDRRRAGLPRRRGRPADAVLEADCDVLIPAAGGSAITEENAGRDPRQDHRRRGQRPADPAADEILNARDVFIIPDILCNAGGVFVSYLEYTQETQRDQMTREEVDNRLNQRMTSTFEPVYERATRTETDAPRGNGHRRQPGRRRHPRPRPAALRFVGGTDSSAIGVPEAQEAYSTQRIGTPTLRPCS